MICRLSSRSSARILLRLGRRCLHQQTPQRSQQTGLRVLFCGSDEFSAKSLERLYHTHVDDHSVVDSLGVVIKKGKLSGRGMHTIRDVKAKAIAHSLNLQVDEIETFTGWSPRSPVDLIIAVSFGLKVPPRLLYASTYGGWNVHPSLLPEYDTRGFENKVENSLKGSLHGPAPLQHALLQGRRSSGVTLQTLHPVHFDQGRIVDQMAFDLPSGGDCSFEQLRDHAAAVGAELLVKNITDLARRRNVESREQVIDGDRNLTHAAKITRQERRVEWSSWSMDKILRAQRALGDVWSEHQQADNQSTIAVTWHDLQKVEEPNACRQQLPEHEQKRLRIGEPQIIPAMAIQHMLDSTPKAADKRVVIATVDEQLLMPTNVTIAGRRGKEYAVTGVQHLQSSGRKRSQKNKPETRSVGA